MSALSINNDVVRGIAVPNYSECHIIRGALSMNIYNDSKYTKWYYSIIQTAVSRCPVGYSEIHHIVPRCIGGKNNSSNLIKLSAREHFVCHLLLVKMVSGKNRMKMSYALNMMSTVTNRYTSERYKVNSVEYSLMRKFVSENAKFRTPLTEEQVANKSKRISLATTGVKKTIDAETKEKISKIRSENKKGKVPWNKEKTYKKKTLIDPWNKGKGKPSINKICQHCSVEFTVLPDRSARKYCSVNCSNLASIGRKRGSWSSERSAAASLARKGKIPWNKGKKLK